MGARACIRVFFVATPTVVDVKDRAAAPAQQSNWLKHHVQCLIH